MAREEPAMSARLTAEAFGTFFLVFTVFCNVLGKSHPAVGVLSISSVLMLLIYALGDISGAHLNPAVTVAISLSQQQKWMTSCYYIVAQVFGGILAGLCAYAIFGNTFNLGPGEGHTWMQAGFAEFFYTFMLCFVVLNTACCRANAGNQYFGLAIGGVIAAGGYAVGGVSGGCFNPAVSFAIDVSSAKMYFSVAYFAFQLLGAAAAAYLYKFLRPADFGMPAPTGMQEKLVAEFVGTFVLTFTAGCNIVGGSQAAALSIAASLMCMIYALGSVSGAHFNPAVTFGIFMSGRNQISGKDAGYYAMSQTAGAVCAGLSYASLMQKSAALAPAQGFSWAHMGAAEVLFTFVLCYAVLAVATTSQPSKDMFGAIIGGCVTVGGFAAAASGGGVLNPAVAVGLDAANTYQSKGAFWHSLAYGGLELAGGALAAQVFKQTHTSEYK